MERRDFLANSAFAAIAQLLIEREAFAQQPDANQVPQIDTKFNLTEPYGKDSLQQLYNGVRGPRPAPEPPQIFLYYDKDSKPSKFVNPTEIKPTLESGNYELGATLRAFNIAKASADKFRNLQQDLQLGLNFATPTQDGQDKLTWLLMNAIDVFAQKPANVSAQLSKLNNYSPTGTLKTPSSKVTVSSGVLDLQVAAFGQKKKSFWKKLFDILTKVVDSPLIGAFAIPSLLKDSVDFVNKSLNILETQDNLVSVWETRSTTFGVDKSATDQYYFLKDGPWVTIDSKFATDNNYLEKGFALDIVGQSFLITDTSGTKPTPIDANYLVIDLKFKTSTNKPRPAV